MADARHAGPPQECSAGDTAGARVTLGSVDGANSRALISVEGRDIALDFLLRDGDMRPDQVEFIADSLGVTIQDVVDMNWRLSGDRSLNSRFNNDSDSSEWLDWLADDIDSPETELAESEELQARRTALYTALDALNKRERRIFEARRLADKPTKLEELADEFGVSRERVRQIEMNAFAKVQKAVERGISKASSSTRQ